MTAGILGLGRIAIAPDRIVCGCERCRVTDWAAAPLVDALPDFIQAGKADWCDMTLAQAWQLGWRP